MHFTLALFSAYLLGSIPFTQIIAHLRAGLDLRAAGTGNVGARNLGRQLGFRWGLLGGVLDAAKGAAALLLARALLPPGPVQIWPAVAVVAGHCWPLWLRFKGGNGLATALGLMLAIAPLESLLAFIGGLLVLRLSGNILGAALTGFILVAGLMSRFHYPAHMYWTLLAVFLTVFIASLPDNLRKLRASGGWRGYLRDPDKIYWDNASEF